MRIIGGDKKGMRFHPPNNIPARPTTDFAKEALFNILNNVFYFDEVAFLDLFAGTGSISYEMFSRGCEDVTSVEISTKMIRFIKSVSEKIAIPSHDIVQRDVFEYIRFCHRQFDVIFAGPPYPLENIDDIPDLILEKGMLKEDGWFILETSPRHDFNEHPNLFKLKKYGQTHFWIFKTSVQE